MRVACPCMMARNLARAAGSSLAVPCKVSMKPSSAASGVRSSWLALATKSARISSTRRSGVRSLNVISRMSERPSPAVASFTGVTKASNQRSSGTRSKNSTRCGCPAGGGAPDRLDQFRHAQGDQGRLAAAQRRRDRRRRRVEGDDAAVAVEHDRRPGQSADQRLDQQGLRMRGGAVGYRRHPPGIGVRAQPAEQREPRPAQAARPIRAARQVCAVVFARHGQSALVFSASISLRSGAVTLVTGCNAGFARAPRIFSHISRAPKIISAMTNGTK